jgi:hypothetical protein
MYSIPSPLRVRILIEAYALVLFAEFIVFGLTSVSFAVFLLISLASVVPFIAIWFAKKTQYSFGEVGLYRRGRLLLDWSQVSSVQVMVLSKSFYHGLGFVLAPRNPVLVAAVLELPDPSDNLREVDHSLTVTVSPKEGRRRVIPADFDGFMDRVLGQKMQDVISSRHLAVSVSFVEHKKA